MLLACPTIHSVSVFSVSVSLLLSRLSCFPASLSQDVHDVPHLTFWATTCIEPDTELAYDYGERDLDTTSALPWLLQ